MIDIYRKYMVIYEVFGVLKYLPAAAPSTESWLPVSLGVLIDFDGDIGVGTMKTQKDSQI